MKNHFIFAYTGNKRTEVDEIYNAILKNNSLDNIDTIVEPYCGSSAISFFISTKHPKKFKYILNDNNNFLIELYKIISDDEKTRDFIKKINTMCFDKDLKFMSKVQYNILMKLKTVESYFVCNKFYKMRCGLYPIDQLKKPIDIEKFLKIPIITFLKNENVKLSTEDAIECIKTNNNNKTLILCDPPYLMACNDFYNNSDVNIYEWLYINNKILINTAFILENNWIIQLLFKDVKEKTVYIKVYTGLKKKVSNHVIAFYNNK
jgi:site-specific DNA-adenine methylase